MLCTSQIVLECLPGDDLQDVHIDPSYLSKEMVELLRNISWLCSNLMRGKAPSPNIKHLSHGARFIGRLLWHPDAEVARDAVWGLSYCVDGPDEQIELLTQRPDVVTKVRISSALLTIACTDYFCRLQQQGALLWLHRYCNSLCRDCVTTKT